MKILLRLPNWLGDMVMSAAFIEQVKQAWPDAAVSVIAKKGIHTLLDLFPGIENQYIFSKEEFPGLRGAYKFGKLIRSQEMFDLFFCLPDSFSSAVMAYATGIPVRVGYKKELRSTLLTHKYLRPENMHRVDEYLQLLSDYNGKPTTKPSVKLLHAKSKRDHIVVNINSEAESRRLPAEKATAIVACLRKHSQQELVFVGSQQERVHVEKVVAALPDKKGIHIVAGRTSLSELADTLASASAVLTTDSGPAHLANALGTPTVVLFGAGDERNTSPYNKEQLTIIRLGQLPCEPCKKNECRLFEVPKCLTLLDELKITKAVLNYIN